MAKDLPAVDFHVALARRNPTLAERLQQEGIVGDVSPVSPEPTAHSPTPSNDPIEADQDGNLAPVQEQEALPAQEVRPAPETLIRPKRVAKRTERTEKATPTRRRGIVTRSGGKEAGRVTVYVPPDLALRLRKYCFEHDRTITDVAGEILIEALERTLG